MNKRYGVSFPASSPILFDKIIKSRFKFKNIIINGKDHQYQGYENVVLNEYRNHELISKRSEVPDIKYIGKDKKRHIYYPDLFVKNLNLIVETKSEFTFSHYEDLCTHILKAEAVIRQTYNQGLFAT